MTRSTYVFFQFNLLTNKCTKVVSNLIVCKLTGTISCMCGRRDKQRHYNHCSRAICRAIYYHSNIHHPARLHNISYIFIPRYRYAHTLSDHAGAHCIFSIFYFFPTDTTCQYNLYRYYVVYICYYFIVIVIFYLVFTVRTSSLELFVRLLCEIKLNT